MDCIVPIVLILAGVLMYNENVDTLMSKYEKKLNRKRKIYNLKKIRFVLFIIFSFVGIILLFDYFDTLKNIPLFLIYIIALALVILVIKVIISKPKD